MRPSETCAYCGSFDAETRDHVPPRGFFRNKLPANTKLITVPCCTVCRDRYQKVDEKARIVFELTVGTQNNPVVRDNWPAVARGARRPEAHGFAQGIINSTFPVIVPTPSGLFEVQRGITLDTVFIIEKTARGLYYHEHHVVVPKQFRFHWFPKGAREAIGMFAEPYQPAVDHVMRNGLRVIDPDVFSYAWGIFRDPACDQPPGVLCFMRFYRRLEFAILMAPRNQPGG